MSSTTQTLVDEVLGGAHDESLDALIDAAHTRKKALAKIRATQVQVGDRVRLVDIRPKYIDGATGTVTDRTSKGFRVQPDDHAMARITARRGQRYLDMAGTIGVPETCVEPIDGS